MKLFLAIAVVYTAVTVIGAGAPVTDTPQTEAEITTCVTAAISTNTTLQTCVSGIDFTTYMFEADCKTLTTQTPARRRANLCIYETSFKCSKQPSLVYFLEAQNNLDFLVDYDLTIDRAYNITCENTDKPAGCNATQCQPTAISVDIDNNRLNFKVFAYVGHALATMMKYCDALKCVDGLDSSCPSTAHFVKHIYYRTMTSIVPVTTPKMDNILFAKYRTLIEDNCPLTNSVDTACIKTQVNSAAFTQCIKDGKVNIAKDSAVTCLNYFAMKKCIMSHVASTCTKGDATQAVITAARFGNGKIPFGCVVESGAGTVFVSAFTLILGLFVTLI